MRKNVKSSGAAVPGRRRIDLDHTMQWIVGIIIAAYYSYKLGSFVGRRRSPSSTYHASSTLSASHYSSLSSSPGDYLMKAKESFSISSPVSSLTSTATATATATTVSTKNKIKEKDQPPKVPPEKCKYERLSALNKALPDWRCQKYWRSDCSFRAKTIGCQDPILAREFFASKKFNKSGGHPFVGILFGWDINDVPIDMLRIGSKLSNDPKYDVTKWNQLIGKKFPCRRSLSSDNDNTNNNGNNQKKKVIVIDWEEITYKEKEQELIEQAKLRKRESSMKEEEKLIPKTTDLFELKKEMGLTDDEFSIHNVKFDDYSDKYDSFTDLIWDQDGVANQPIHYMHIEKGDGMDYQILMKMVPSLLKRIRYLKFQYNKHNSWKGKGLKPLIDKLKDSGGLYCYWSGNAVDSTDTNLDKFVKLGKNEAGGNMLWRITDCFLEHFDYNQFARIQCVSSIHDDVKELALQMETKFLNHLHQKENEI